MELEWKSHDDFVLVALSPDGKTVFTGVENGMLGLWEAATGKSIRSWKGDAWIRAVAFSRDGKTLLSYESGKGGTVCRWDAANGKELSRFQVPDGAMCIAFAPDGETAALGYRNNTIRVHEAATGKEVRSWLGDAGRRLVFTADGRTLAAHTMDGRIRLWEATTGKAVAAWQAHAHIAENLAFSPDGKNICSVGTDGKIVLWETLTGKEIRAFKGLNMSRTMWWPMIHIVFSPRGESVIMGRGTMFSVWDVATGKEKPVQGIQREMHDEWIQYVGFSPDGKTLVTRGLDLTVRFWDVATGKPTGKWDWQGRITKPAGTAIVSTALAPDGNTLAVSTNGGEISLWDVATGMETRSWLHVRSKNEISVKIAFSPDGKTLASGAGNVMGVRLWEVATGKEIRAWETISGDFLSFSPDGKTLAIGPDSLGTVGLWEADSGRQIRVWQGTDTVKNAGSIVREQPYGLLFAPDGKSLAVATRTRTRRWEVATGKELPELKGASGLYASCCFSPDGTMFVCADGSTIRIYATATGKEIGARAGHKGFIATVAFSRDGKKFASAGSDKTVLVWDVPPHNP
jgi:WD40 repeat protein